MTRKGNMILIGHEKNGADHTDQTFYNDGDWTGGTKQTERLRKTWWSDSFCLFQEDAVKKCIKKTKRAITWKMVIKPSDWYVCAYTQLIRTRIPTRFQDTMITSEQRRTENIRRWKCLAASFIPGSICYIFMLKRRDDSSYTVFFCVLTFQIIVIVFTEITIHCPSDVLSFELFCSARRTL